MLFVCPSPPVEASSTLPYPRLYAYPRIPIPPVDNELVILDSGAYGLSLRRQAMTPEHITLLAEHYRQFSGENVVCIAPDEYLNPARSMQNFRDWIAAHAIPVAPVIQFRRQRRLDLYLAQQQMKTYAAFVDSVATYQGRPVVCISNPGLNAIESKPLTTAIRHLRNLIPNVWLHNLGAGWWPQDVRLWRQSGAFDSIDSISYYTDAQQGIEWLANGDKRFNPNHPAAALIAHNADIARHIH